ncbi:MAG: glycerophosphodiester phosphodiesterase [Thiovulaceae bacterium]|nr:glycerophosphodiester phosphodiesterase [Sulfurimonadaceae bacterium]
MKIIAHRGYSEKYLENTLQAFEEAVNADVDMIELDVRLSKDGTAMIFHDKSLKRLSGMKDSIETLTIDELALVTLEDKEGNSHTIPRLDEVITLVNGRCKLILELKEQGNVKALCEAVEKRISDHLSWIEVSCFDDAVLETIHGLNTKIALHKLIETKEVLNRKDFHTRYAYISYFDIDVALQHATKVKHLISNHKVVFWTVAGEDISEAIGLGLYGAMSNDPVMLRAKWF